MRLSSVTLVLAILSAPVVRADDKTRTMLQKLNPLTRFKKEEPVNKSKQLAESLRTDPDEKKRKSAAIDLRDTDAKESPDVIPVLVASLKQDPSAAVRTAVADTIGKLKPMTPSAGVVLEAAAVNDPSEAVRKASQAALTVYQQSGYRLTAMTVSQTAEPPFAKPRPQMAAQPATRQIVAPPVMPAAPPTVAVPGGVNRGPTFTETSEPPIARGKPTPMIPNPVPVETPIPAPAPIKPIPAPVIQMPTPMPLPSAPKLPTPLPLPGKPSSGSAIPTPPPSTVNEF